MTYNRALLILTDQYNTCEFRCLAHKYCSHINPWLQIDVTIPAKVSVRLVSATRVFCVEGKIYTPIAFLRSAYCVFVRFVYQLFSPLTTYTHPLLSRSEMSVLLSTHTHIHIHIHKHSFQNLIASLIALHVFFGFIGIAQNSKYIPTPAPHSPPPLPLIVSLALDRCPTKITALYIVLGRNVQEWIAVFKYLVFSSIP